MLVAIVVAVGAELVARGREQQLIRMRDEPPPNLPQVPLDIGSLAIGSQSAPVGVVEFTDLNCEACLALFRETVSRIKSEFIDPGLVRYSFRVSPWPGPNHRSIDAASVFVCAARQDVLWMALNNTFRAPSTSSLADLKRSFVSNVADGRSFGQCVDSQPGEAVVSEGIAVGAALQSKVRPEIYVGPLLNGRILPYYRLQGAADFAVFSDVLRYMKLGIESGKVVGLNK
jgi:protein-disulfide isomerase